MPLPTSFCCVIPLLAVFGLALAGPSDAAEFVHPGILHRQQDLDRMKAAVAAQTNPIYQGYVVFAADSGSKSTYTMQGPFAGFGRGTGENTTPMHNDANAAYQNAVMWAVTGNSAHAAKAIQILNGWASTMTAVLGTESVLCAMDGYKLVNAAEILRYTPSGWSSAEVARSQVWFKEVWYPSFKDFAYYANGNWDGSAIKTMMAIAVFCDDRPMYERAVRYYLDGAGNGRLTYYVINDAGQAQESGRDQPHTMLGLGLLSEAAQIGWNQGLDLFSVAGNRLLKGFEYTANYNLGNTVTFTPALDRSGKYGVGGTASNYNVISTVGRGGYRPVFELILNHYRYRAGLPASSTPFTQQFVDANRPEGAATSADHPGFGTFLFSLTGPAAPALATGVPLKPAGLFAYGSTSGNRVGWAPSRDVLTYTLKRAAAVNGPYTQIVAGLTAPNYTDGAVVAGQVYYYSVSSTNRVGESADALPVAVAAGLPIPWTSADIGAVGVAGRADFDGQTFKLEGGGADIGGTSDQFHFAYMPMVGDGMVIARVTLPLSSQSAKVGVMMRTSAAANSAHVSLFLPVNSQATWVARATAGATTTTVASAAIPAPYVTGGHLDQPYWIKITRVGDVFTGSISPDGANWATVGSSTVALGNALSIGLAACSRLSGVTTTATFDEITAPGFPAPVITSQPVNLSAQVGSSVTFSATVSGTGLSYQWMKNGVALTGATNATLTLYNIQTSDAGSYAVAVSNLSGQTLSTGAALTIDNSTAVPKAGRIVNISVRSRAGVGDQTLIAGFVISGTGTKPVMVRAAGPTLANFGVSGVVADPRLDLHLGGNVVAQNDSWKLAPNPAAILAAGGDRLGTFPLDPKDAIITSSLLPTAYTAVVSSSDGTSGVALVEVYDTDTALPGTPEFDAQPRLVNISARSQVGTGANILIAGFVINGSVPKRVMIRACGSTLKNFGVSGVLSNPVLQLYSGPTMVAQNSGWQTAPNLAEVRSLHGDFEGAYPLDPKDSVIVTTLTPGAFTAQVSGANGGTGVALIEVFDED